VMNPKALAWAGGDLAELNQDQRVASDVVAAV